MYEARQNKEKVSRRIDGGGMARQKVKLKRNNQNNIIQRKDLNPNSFNLAGEDHGESEKRRNKEQWYANARGLNYYTEHEYKYTENDKQVVGDSIMLRLEHLLYFQIKYYKIQLEQFSQEMSPNNSSISNDTTTDWKKFLESYKKSIDEIMLQMSIIKDDTDESSLYYRKLLPFYNIMKISSDLCSKIINNQSYSISSLLIKTFSRNPKQIIMHDASSLLNELNNFIFYFKHNVINRDINNNISNNRSIRMNDIANKNYQKKVLWKVGNDHIEDIKKMNGNINYHILTKNEFDAGYSTYFNRFVE